MTQPDEEDDVIRDYYVYVHRCKATGTPFYVGKGRGKRARSEDRLECWHEAVAKLPKGYEVETAKDRLTEGGAYDLERELIAQYGKLSDGTGTLTNITDGGHLDFGEGPIVELNIEIPGAKKHYAKLEFRPISATEKHALASTLKSESTRVQDELIALLGDEDETARSDLESVLEENLDNLLSDCRHVNKKKISREDFCWTIFSCWEDLEFRPQDIVNEKPEVVRIAKDLREFLTPIVNSIVLTFP